MVERPRPLRRYPPTRAAEPAAAEVVAMAMRCPCGSEVSVLDDCRCRRGATCVYAPPCHCGNRGAKRKKRGHRLGHRGNEATPFDSKRRRSGRTTPGVAGVVSSAARGQDRVQIGRPQPDSVSGWFAYRVLRREPVGEPERACNGSPKMPAIRIEAVAVGGDAIMSSTCPAAAKRSRRGSGGLRAERTSP